MDEGMRLAMDNMKSSLNKRYVSEPAWEDKHPILATLMIIFAFIFNPATLLIIGIFSILGILIGVLL